MNEKNNKIFDFLKTPLFLTFCTVLIYWLTFFYESQYLSYFSIPSDFVDIELSNLVYIGIVFFTICLLVVFLPILLDYFFKPKSVKLRIRLLSLYDFTVPLFLLFWVWGKSTLVFLLLFCFAVLKVNSELRKGNISDEKIIEEFFPQKKWLSSIQNNLDILFLAVVISTVFILNLGEYKASHKNMYTTYETEEDKILVVSSYKDKLLGVSYEEGKEQEESVCSKIYIINMADEVVTKLKVEKIPERKKVRSCYSENEQKILNILEKN